MRMKWRWIVTAAVLLLALSACNASVPGVASLGGKSSREAKADKPKDADEAFLAFTTCMREHGIDMPDPQTSGDDAVVFEAPAEGAPDGLDEKMIAAEKECRKHLEDAGFAPGTHELDPKMQDAMLEFAKCMREHGIEMPDPGDNGFVVRKGQEDPDFDPRSEKFQTAEKACRHIMEKAGAPVGRTETTRGGVR